MNILLLVLPFLAVQVQAYSINHYELKLTMNDGVILHGDASVPVPEKSGEKFPLIIWANSWGVPEFEYILRGIAWAEAGYIMVEYETRGWYLSGGQIGTAGPLDQTDSITVLDAILNRTEWNVDVNNIAFAGISYGAGLAALAGAHDSRVKTVLLMSGWASLQDALYGKETPNLVYGNLLVLLAKLVGKAPPDLVENYDNLLHHTNVTSTLAWAAVRSPITYIDKINAKKLPVFVSNNFLDELFSPEYQIQWWQRLQGPKYLLLNQGLHATAELGGLILPGNYVFDQAKLWIDYWLKGIQNGVMDLPPVVMQLRNDFNVHQRFETWPSIKSNLTKWSINYRGSKEYGGLVLENSESKINRNVTDSVDSIYFEKSTGLTAGFPVIGDLLQVYVDVPITVELPLVSRRGALVYMSGHLPNTIRIAGSPQVFLTVTPSSERFQIVSYLYSVDFLGIGTLIAHGPFTCWNCTVGVPVSVEINLRSLLVDVADGRRLALCFSLYSDLYEPANTNTSLNVAFGYVNNARLEFSVVDRK